MTEKQAIDLAVLLQAILTILEDVYDPETHSIITSAAGG